MHVKQKPQQPVPPAKLLTGTKDPVLSTRPPKVVEDWKFKNARAKELIMSNLAPGGAPWNIAEPLELASHIWEVLETRYTPTDSRPTENKEFVTTVTTSAATLMDEEAKFDRRCRQESQARATKEFYDSIPDRDQRFLWTLLHGGKDETNDWFYGLTEQT